MTFKDIKQNNTVFILDKNNLKVISAKVINASQPKVDMSKPNSCMSGTTLIVDIDLNLEGKTVSYSIPENLEITYTNTGLVLAIDPNKLVNEVNSLHREAKDQLAKKGYYEEVIKKTPDLMAELNPQLKEKQETDRRLNLMESSISNMQSDISKMTSLVEKLANQLGE